MKMFRIFLVMLVAFGAVAPAYAADIYKDPYTTEDEDGNWTYSGTVKGGKKSVTVITTGADTVGTVTTAKSGGLFVLTASSGTVGGVGYTLTLPTAASGLEYTFTTATNQTIAVRSNASTDLILWDDTVGRTRYTSPASTGSTITVVGNTSRWYVTNMVTPAGAGSPPGHQDWVAGDR